MKRTDLKDKGSSVDRLLTTLLLSGARGVAYALTAASHEGLTYLADTITLDDDVVARVRGVDRDGQGFDEVQPLWWAVEHVAKGARIDRIERPDPAMLFWQAAALVRPLVEVPVWQRRHSGIFAVGRAAQPVGLVLVAAADRRGLGGVVWAHDERGDGFLHQLTSNPLGQSRMYAAQETLRRQLGPAAFRSAFRTAAAAAVTAYLQRDDALAGKDEAPPSLTWVIAAGDRQGHQRLLAAHPPGATSRDHWGRWNGMFEAVVSELNIEAFSQSSGPELDPDDLSPKTGRPRPRVVASLDASAGPLDGSGPVEEALGDTVPDRHDLLERVELNDLIDRASLAPRQRQVLALRLSGLSYGEIAQRLGISIRTVGATLNQVRTKIERESVRD